MAIKPAHSHHQNAGFMTGLSLLLPITLSTMAVVLLAPIIPQMVDEYKFLSNFQYWVPMAVTVPALCVAIISPIGGMLGDYFGRRKLLIWSLILYGFVGVAPVFISDFNMLFLTRIGVGITEGMIMVLTTTMIGDYFKGETRDKWLAAQTAVASMSAIVFFNVGGILGAISWRMPFWVYASSLLMLILVLAYTWEPSKSDPDENADSAPHNLSWADFPWAIFIPIMLITVYGSVFFYTVQIQASMGLSQLGLTDPARIGMLTSIASIGVPVGTVIFSRLSKTPAFKLLTVEFAMLAIGFTIMATATDTTTFLIGCFINQLGAGMLLPTLLVWAMSFLSFEIRGRGAGLWTGAFSVGQFLCSIIVPAISGDGGALGPAFRILSYAALAGAVLAAVYWMTRPKTTKAS
jgi:MFS family permease